MEGLGVTILVGGMVIAFIGLLMFCISLIGSHLLANVVAMIFVIMPMIQLNIGMAVPELDYVSPVSWMNLSEIDITGTGSGLPFSYCVATLGIMCILLSMAIIWKIKTVDFQMVKED